MPRYGCSSDLTGFPLAELSVIYGTLSGPTLARLLAMGFVLRVELAASLAALPLTTAPLVFGGPAPASGLLTDAGLVLWIVGVIVMIGLAIRNRRRGGVTRGGAMEIAAITLGSQILAFVCTLRAI